MRRIFPDKPNTLVDSNGASNYVVAVHHLDVDVPTRISEFYNAW
jgi:hypothetical protein